MDHFGHGSLLSGRYRLDERRFAGGDHDLWVGHDTVLDRKVGLHVLAPDATTAQELMDRAAVASRIDDHRLVRILDLGSSDGATYVVTEHVHGQTLVEALAQGPLPGEAARRIVGEAASGLAVAHEHGAYHLRLTPEEILIAPDGSIKVSGLAVRAALNGIRPGNADVAGRTDALGLVAVLYAGLTGRWPLAGATGLAPAPRVHGRPVPPVDLVAGVADDLNDLCAEALVPGSPVAVSPAHLAAVLAPWARLEPLSDPGGLALAPHRGHAPVNLNDTVMLPPEPPAPEPEPAEVPIDEFFDGMGAAPHGSAADWQLGRQPHGGPAQGQPAAMHPVAATALGLDEPGATRASGQQSKVVMAVIGMLVAVALVAAGVTLADVLGRVGGGSSSTAGPGTSSTDGTGGTDGTEDPDASSSTSTTSAEPAAEVEVSSITSIDPEGDGSEHGEDAKNAIDGDKKTIWYTETYYEAGYGTKKGVGLVLTLSQTATVSEVAITSTPSGGAVEVRKTSSDGLDGSTVVGTSSLGGGETVIDLSEPVETQKLVVWVTELPKASGGYRLSISEITVR